MSILPLHIHRTSQLLVPSPDSSTGRLAQLLPHRLTLYVPPGVVSAENDSVNAKYAWIRVMDEEKKEQHDDTTILATLTYDAPQYLAQDRPTNALIVSETAHRLFLSSSTAPSQAALMSSIRFTAVASHTIPAWSSVRVRVLNHRRHRHLHQYQALSKLPASSHPLFAIDAATDDSSSPVDLSSYPPLSSIHRSLLHQPMFALPSQHESHPFLHLFLDHRYHAIELCHGRYDEVYGEEAMQMGRGWGVITKETRIEWASEEEDEDSITANAAVKPIDLPIDSLFETYLPSFNEDFASEELKHLALLVKTFAASPPLSPASRPSSSLLSPHSLLLHGAIGCGKRTFLTHLSSLYHLPLHHISFSKLITNTKVASQVDAMKQEIQRIKMRVMQKQGEEKLVIVIHELEVMFAMNEERDVDILMLQNEFEKLMEEINHSSSLLSRHTLLIGLTSSASYLPASILKSFQYSFSITAPSNDGRRRILQANLSQNHLLDSSQLNLEWLVEQTQGYVGADLVGLIRATVARAMQRQNVTGIELSHALTLTTDDFRQSLEKIRPASMKGMHVVVRSKDAPVTAAAVVSSTSTSSSSSSSTFTAVSGLTDVKSRLRELLLWPLLYSHHFTSLGIRSTKGILLYGPPGVGKTLIARTLAQEWNLSFIILSLSELIRAGVGESERYIKEIFTRAKEVAPSILFLDEVQAIFGKTSKEGNGLTEKMMAQLLGEIDALESGGSDNNTNSSSSSSISKRVLLLGATNVPSSLDPSLLRSGRLDQILYIGPPDAEARKSILLMNQKQAKWSQEILNEKLDEIVRRTDGFSGVDMVQLVGRAGFYAVQRDPLTCQQAEYCDFESALRNMTSSITHGMIRTCEKWGNKWREKRMSKWKPPTEFNATPFQL